MTSSSIAGTGGDRKGTARRRRGGPRRRAARFGAGCAPADAKRRAAYTAKQHPSYDALLWLSRFILPSSHSMKRRLIAKKAFGGLASNHLDRMQTGRGASSVLHITRSHLCATKVMLMLLSCSWIQSSCNLPEDEATAVMISKEVLTCISGDA